MGCGLRDDGKDVLCSCLIIVSTWRSRNSPFAIGLRGIRKNDCRICRGTRSCRTGDVCRKEDIGQERRTAAHTPGTVSAGTGCRTGCLSCHQTASVPGRNNKTPAILYQIRHISQGPRPVRGNARYAGSGYRPSLFQQLPVLHAFHGLGEDRTPTQLCLRPEAMDLNRLLAAAQHQSQPVAGMAQDLARKRQGVTERVFEGVLPGTMKSEVVLVISTAGTGAL